MEWARAIGDADAGEFDARNDSYLAMTDDHIAEVLLALLGARSADATICPSEVARAIEPDDEAAWRALMPDVRRIAAELATRGVVRVTQKGRPVDAMTARGPIRLGRPPGD